MTNSQKQFCKQHNITEDQFFGKTPVGGYLDLGSFTSIPDGFNPTVGGSLYLRSLTSIPEGFNPTVGGYLDLGSLTSIPDGFNPTVGGYLYLCSLTSIPEGFKKSDYENKNVGLLSWQKCKYIFCDGRFSEVIKRRGNVWKLKDVNKDNTYYLVTDGNNRYAHGDSIKEAKEDLIYKISDRDKSKYVNADTNKKYTFLECIEMYRTITGACATGTKNFIESTGLKNKSYSINEIAKITKDAYGGNSFRSFFNIQP
jgi:hypothetical protein